MPIVRRGTVDDIESLIRLRAVMFDTMNVDYERAEWEPACRQILLDGLSSGDLVAAVAETDDRRIVACGIGAVRRWLPSPRNPTGLRGYIGSVATDDAWRRQDTGRKVIECLVEILQARGVAEIDLHATEEYDEGLYRAIGFVERDGGAELRYGGSADPALSPDV